MSIEEKYKLITTENTLPKKIQLDICNLCQLNCPACYIRMFENIIKVNKDGFGFVNFETFKNFIDKHPFIEEIELSNNGEIFLNPDLEKIIEYAYFKNIKLMAFAGVNFNDITETMPETLVKYQFQGMSISIDGATPETYAIYRRRGNFNKVINNIKKVNKYKEIYNTEFPHLIYKFVLFGHNEHEIEQAKELAKELNMDIDFIVNFKDDYSPLKNPEKVKELTGIKYPDNYMKYLYDRLQNGHWFPCNELFNSPHISPLGYFHGCCMVFREAKFDINVFENGLLNALNDEKVLYAKQMVLDKNIIPRKDIPCTYCHVYKFLKGNNLPLL